ITFVGGAEKVAINLANKLCDIYDVTVISLFQWQNQNNVFLGNDNVKNISLGLEKCCSVFSRLLLNIRNRNKLKGIFNCYDYVIGNNFFRYYVYPFKTNCKLCEIQHLRFEEEKGGDSFIRRLLYRKLDKLIVLTENDSAKFRRSGYVNIETIPNFISDIKENISYNNKSKRIVAIGRLAYQKNYNDMLDIMFILKKKHPDFILDILGEGDEKTQIEKKIIDLKLSENVVLHGAVENVDDYLSNAALLISTSRYEGFPLSFLEALNFELPIITYDFDSGARDIVFHSENGILVNIGEKSVFANYLAEFLENENIRIKFSKKARYLKKLYSSEVVVKQWQTRIFNDA
ncbi:glycosyltransferase family 4 protein, partial [Escherichia coli]